MQITCPQCGEPVSAEHINIQHMTAVCPACSTIFRFNPPEAKIKRRKVKQPTHFKVIESGSDLSLSFRTNFRLDKNESFIFRGILSFAFTFISAITINEYFSGDAPFILALGFTLVALFLYYLLSLVVFNKTDIRINDETIQVSRKPIPDFLNQPQSIGLAGVERVRYEETPASIRESYDTPRYHVWAEMIDGSRKIIVSDLVDDYAIFITQRLTEYLDLDNSNPAISRLMDDEQHSHDTSAFQAVDRGHDHKADMHSKNG
ncbi:MAG: zinc ribbon domain-containing protein [Anaerolineae bacterium]|nr:zinc ribbon domain-containing protein [Anaerolineae bacterium]